MNWRRTLKWLLVSAGTLVLLVAALLGAFGIVVGRVPEYRVQVQDWLNDRTGVVVEFRALSARLRFFGPELIFEDAIVRTPDRTQILATAKRGSVGFDIWGSLRNGRLSAGRFSLRSPQISLIRTREGRVQMLGQTALPERQDAKPIALEQLPTGRFRVRDALVTFRDELTGRGPWSMSGISFELLRDVGSIELHGEASLPEALGRRLQFAANAEGGLEDPRGVVCTFSVSGEALDLAGWADVVPDEWPAPETGHGSVRLSGSLRGPELTELKASVDFKGISSALPLWATMLPKPEPMPENEQPEALLELAQDRVVLDTAATHLPLVAPVAEMEMVSYERIALVAHAKRNDDGWHLAISDLDISRAGVPWQAKQIEVQWSNPQPAGSPHPNPLPGGRGDQGERGDVGMTASVKADRIVLENVWPLLAYLPESEQLARLRALAARGTIESLNAQLERAAPDAQPMYSVQATLSNIGFAPIERTPGFTGISGTLQADEVQGELQLAARDVSFTLPRMFRDVLAAESVAGTLRWNLDDTGVTVRSDELRLASEDGRASGSLRLLVPRDRSSPVLELSARGEDLKVSSTGKYVPGHKLSKKTLAWFDRAFVDGRVRSATFELKGPIRVFPFRNGEGTFDATAEVEDAALAYHDAWMPATGIDAEVTFHNQGMTARAKAAHVGGVPTENAVAEIKDFKQNELRLSALASGDLQHAFEFLRASPLNAALGEQFEQLEGQGALSADLKLFLPMKHMEDRDVRIVARIANGFVKHREIEAPVRALNGNLTVRNALITEADLQGRWLSGPLHVSVQAQNAQSAMLTASGRAEAAQLQSLLDVPARIGISGAADWRLTMPLSVRDEAAPVERTFHVFADLRDFGLDLPAPLGKEVSEERTLDLDLSLEAHDRAVVRGALGEVRALLSLKRNESGWQLDRGGVRADGQPASVPSHRGLRIEGTIDRFVMDDWLALRDSGVRTGKPLSAYLQAANVRVGSFELYGYRWSDLRGILQATPSGWRVDVEGPEATGQIIIPETFTGAQPLRAAMERLVLRKVPREERTAAQQALTPTLSLEGEGSSEAPTDPRKLPALDVHIADLTMGQRLLGAVDISAARVTNGLRFDEIAVAGNSMHGEGRGEWLMTDEGPRSTLSAALTSTDVAATLASLDYTPFLEGQHGQIRGQLSWPGGYDDNVLDEASGTISVRAESGQIVNLQPGAGRVLGLFSVAALPRRLALDFSDLTDKGLAFDTIQGDFDLREGNAYTTNLLLRGPAAEIGIAGRTGFGTRDYDQTAVVTGNLGASLPVAGALAGGPAVGAALLLFSQVFKEPLKGMTRGYYRITGPWDNPNVERVDASTAKDASARAAAAPILPSAAQGSANAAGAWMRWSGPRAAGEGR